MKTKNLVLISSLVLLAACSTVYTSTVTITEVVDSAMKNWAQASVNGLTGPQIDAKVVEAHNVYRGTCAVAKGALEKYKITGDPTDYTAALKAVRDSVDSLFELILPLVSKSTAQTLETNLENARSL